jgi:hypothetical protein
LSIVLLTSDFFKIIATQYLRLEIIAGKSVVLDVSFAGRLPAQRRLHIWR